MASLFRVNTSRCALSLRCNFLRALIIDSCPSGTHYSHPRYTNCYLAPNVASFSWLNAPPPMRCLPQTVPTDSYEYLCYLLRVPAAYSSLLDFAPAQGSTWDTVPWPALPRPISFPSATLCLSATTRLSIGLKISGGGVCTLSSSRRIFSRATSGVSGISKGLSIRSIGSSGVLQRRLELSRGRPRAVHAGVQRIHGWVVKRLVGMPLTFRGIMTTQGY